MNSNTCVIALSLKYKGDWNQIYRAMVQHEQPEQIYVDQVQQLKCNVVTLLDLSYPQQLRNVEKPPFVLYYYGDLSLISNYHNNVSIVGSRNNSSYGERMTNQISSGLAEKGFTIISGMAIGIDSIAHRACVFNKGKTCAVLGSGIDYCYPETNRNLYDEIRQNHLIISEYPLNTSPSPENFPIRNRIIAGLSKTLVVTEAGHRSGSLITAMLALRGNTDVMCVPYPADVESECNQLIKAGACLVENANDVISQMSDF